MAKDQKDTGVSRRGFMKGALAGAGTVALAKMSPKEAEAAQPKKWDKQTDVVCIGYGGAGAATAITAHDAGAKVMILEKMAESGGNTAISGGGFLCPTNVPDALTYISALFEYSHSDMDKDLVRVYSEEAVKNVKWIKGLREGTEVEVYGYAGYPKVPGAKSMEKYHVKGAGKGLTGSAQNLWELLTYSVEKKRKIPVMLGTTAKRLVTDSRGAVIGVIAESQGKEISILAKRGVVLTTGGYEYDQEMLQNSMKGYPIYALGCPGNTGDGVRMAQKVGAGLWHMNGASCPLGIKVPGVDAGIIFMISSPGYIYVDKRGLRFTNERSIEAHAGLLAVDVFDLHSLDYPRIPCYVIFDETTRSSGPISVLAGMGYVSKQYKWSRDNSAEIEKGVILKGDTVADLAAKIKVDSPALEGTLNKWNEDMKRGEDTQFHRPLRDPAKEGPAYKELATAVWSAPIEKPPFYALPLYPTLLNTQGGPRRNTKARVLDAFGQPIPRLYSAGELGSMWGIIYQGAGNIGECIVFGCIAGRNAAAEKPIKL
jgi:succinate dehydrogenase/fumarate reductase flavoprotein subunit